MSRQLLLAYVLMFVALSAAATVVLVPLVDWDLLTTVAVSAVIGAYSAALALILTVTVVLRRAVRELEPVTATLTNTRP